MSPIASFCLLINRRGENNKKSDNSDENISNIYIKKLIKATTSKSGSYFRRWFFCTVMTSRKKTISNDRNWSKYTIRIKLKSFLLFTIGWRVFIVRSLRCLLKCEWAAWFSGPAESVGLAFHLDLLPLLSPIVSTAYDIHHDQLEVAITYAPINGPIVHFLSPVSQSHTRVKINFHAFYWYWKYILAQKQFNTVIYL